MTLLLTNCSGEVLILDVAKRMITISGKKNIEVVLADLRQGEKLNEELVGAREESERPFHPKVVHMRPNTLSQERPDKVGGTARRAEKLRNNDAQKLGRLDLNAASTYGYGVATS